jgi:CubicO group peptidase (beta-lactamase class C family)
MAQATTVTRTLSVEGRVDGPLADTVPAKRPITVDDLLTFRMGLALLTAPTFNPPFPIEPLGMVDTGFWTAPANVERIPSHYMTDFETGELKQQPHRDLIGMALTQTSDFLFNGSRTQFTTLALRAAD